MLWKLFLWNSWKDNEMKKKWIYIIKLPSLGSAKVKIDCILRINDLYNAMCRWLLRPSILPVHILLFSAKRSNRFNKVHGPSLQGDNSNF